LIFFSENLFLKNYELNLTSCEFYLFFVLHQIQNFKMIFLNNGNSNNNKFLSIILENNSTPVNFDTLDITKDTSQDLRILLKIFYSNCILSQYDLGQVESENKEFKIVKNKYDIEDDTEEQDHENFDFEGEEIANRNFSNNRSLRKCCSEILENLSKYFPDQIISIVIPMLENEIGNSDWLIKERSIFVLGVICINTIDVIKSNLHNLTNFLVGELSNTNKLIRATACNSLSKLSEFIMTDSSETLLKLYLSELLKRFLDSEPIVQETACSNFNNLVKSYKDKLAPYLGDIYRIITSIFETYTGTSLMTLYDSLVLLSENYPDSFLDLDLVCELLYGILGKWCSFTQTLKDNQNKPPIPIRSITSPNFFDVIIAVFKISFEIFFCHFDDFFDGCLLIIELYPEDREIICRCLDLISVIMQNLPFQFTNNPNRGALLPLIKNISKLEDDLGYKQYVLALIGDICKVEPTLLNNHFDDLMLILIENLAKFSDRNTISVCNNCCWTISVLTKSFKDNLDFYFEPIISKIILIFSTPKLNKSLAQNAAICLGHMGLVNPQKLSQYLGTITKQFCLSIKIVADGQDKVEAFRYFILTNFSGFCEALIKNPNGVCKNFAFFCDAICQYTTPPENLELLFQNIFSSYKSLFDGKWYEVLNSLPEKLRNKMKNRFPLISEL
jgi:transportin-1